MRVAAAQIPQAQHGGVATGQHLRLQPAVSSIAAKVTIKQQLGRRPILKHDICNMQHIIYILKNNETLQLSRINPCTSFFFGLMFEPTSLVKCPIRGTLMSNNLGSPPCMNPRNQEYNLMTHY